MHLALQIPLSPWLAPLAVPGRPSVGDLMAMCERNYRTLFRLAPGLKALRGEFRSCVRDGGLDLSMEILEQTRYTTLLRLTYLFVHDDELTHPALQPDPDALLRVYHDAGQVELLDLRQTALPLHNHYQSPALEAKLRANLFLSKWLGYCVRQGHCFPESTQSAAGADDLVYSCL